MFDEKQVSEHWIVDPTRDTVRVYRRTAVSAGGHTNGRLALVAEAAARDVAVVTTPLLPGMALPAAALFA